MPHPTSSAGSAFLPSGMTIRIESDGAVIGNRGDLVVEVDLSASLGPIKRLFSETGSVLIAVAELDVGSIEAAGGTAELSGSLQVQHVRARTVRFTSGALRARVIQATDEAALLGEKLEAEVVSAPRVAFGEATSGRATAVGAVHDLGAHKVRGCFSLAEYVDLVPHGRATLDAYGIPVDEPVTAAADGGQPDARSSSPAADDADEDEEGDPAGSGASSEASASGDPGPQIREAMRRIVECYARDDVPPPIDFLETLVSEGGWDDLKLQLNSTWRDLLKYHQKKGLRISNTVTQQFQQIQLVVKRLPG